MIPALLEKALGVIASNRSEKSWIAGSLALAGLLDRDPRDIDIYHNSWTDAENACRMDCVSLEKAGFTVRSQDRFDDELKIFFNQPKGLLEVNWVVQDRKPGGVVDDPVLGKRANYGFVVACKIDLYREEGTPKHRDDLQLLFGAQQDKIFAELNPADFEHDLVELGILDGMNR